MAQNEPFSNCHYSFLSRVLQPFHKHTSSQVTLQVKSALAEDKLTKTTTGEKVISKSTIDLNRFDAKHEQMSIRQFGKCVAAVPAESSLNHHNSVGIVTKPRVSGAFRGILKALCSRCTPPPPSYKFSVGGNQAFFSHFSVSCFHSLLIVCFTCLISVKNGVEIKTVSASVGKKNANFMKEISYTNEKMIGNGSFGVVYQATLIDENEVVAIKRVLQDRRFKNRELNIMVSLEHCNIVRLKYYFYTYKNVRFYSKSSVGFHLVRN